MAEKCKVCGGALPPRVPGKGGRPRTRCVKCSPPGDRDRTPRPPAHGQVIALASRGDGTMLPPKTLRGPQRPAEPTEPPAASDATRARAQAVLEATRKALDEAGAIDTPDGTLALHLAGLLVAGGYTAQGAAALSKSLREALAEALKARVTTDALDELVRKRRERLRGAG